ncbi:MAG: hypothetical protein WDA07_05540 [Leucobacter sp.]
MIDLDELRRLAHRATPGPWEWEEPSDDSYPVGDESLVTTWNEEDGYPKSVVTSWGHDADGVTASAEDRAFIAAAYPQAVLELIERVRQAEKISSKCDEHLSTYSKVRAERDAATEEAFKKAAAFDKAVALSERRQTLLEEAEAERDAALARTAELEEGLRLRHRQGVSQGRTILALESRIAEAAKLHRPTLPGFGPKSCVHDGRAWPCPDSIALGLDEGENDGESDA